MKRTLAVLAVLVVLPVVARAQKPVTQTDTVELTAKIEAIDADHITTLPRGSTAPVRIQRSVVEGISRLGSTVAGSYVGPGGLAGWRVAPDGAWRAEAGRITANRPGTAWCDVGGASRAAYEIVLSWRRRPELRIAVAAAERGDDPFWVELLRFEDGTSEAAVVRREADRAALAPLDAGDASAKRMRLVIFIDQETGLLAAVTAERGGAGVVAQVVLPPATRPASGRFRISLGSGDVCLESLRVGPWTAAEPVLDERTTASVVGKDGRAVAADIAHQRAFAAVKGAVLAPIHARRNATPGVRKGRFSSKGSPATICCAHVAQTGASPS